MLVALAVAAAATLAHAEPPELLADFGGGNTELREIDVSTRADMISYPEEVTSAGAVDVERAKIRYKLYTLLGEPVIDALLYWEMAADNTYRGLVFDGDYRPYLRELLDEFNSVQANPITTNNTSGLVRPEIWGFWLQEMEDRHPDLFQRFLVLKPLNVTIRAIIATGEPAMETAQIDLSIDLPNRSGAWQRLSVPSSPDWDDLGNDVREVFANRSSGEDVRIRSATLHKIEWPDGAIHALVAEFLRREIRLYERAIAQDQSEDDFWDTTDAGLNPEDVKEGRPATTGPASERYRPDRSDNQRYERLAAVDPEAILDIDVYPDKGQRFITINRDASLDGMEVEKQNTRGAVVERVRLGQTYSFELEGAMGSLVFSRNGEVIAEYDKLRDPDYTTVEISDELTDVEVDSRRITIRVNDDGRVDGDRIDLYINGARVLHDHYLSGGGTTREITLQRGPNIIRIVSTDDGDSAPNTSGLRLSNVISGSSEQSWELSRGESATLQIRAPVR